jgi:hypothetical protein
MVMARPPELRAALAAIALVGGCTALAGLDEDYTLGDPDVATNGNGPTSAGPGPNSGSGPGGSPPSSGPGPGNGGSAGSPPGAGGAGGENLGGGGSSPVAIPCDEEVCGEGEVCCAVHQEPNVLVECADADPRDCPKDTFGIECDGDEDCLPGESCCGTADSEGWSSIYCSVSCGGNRTLCGGPDAPDEDQCPDAQCDCVESGDLPGYYHCVGCN